jgi:DNA-binding MarR family transcriptional regulator
VASRQLAVLERSGHVERRPDPQDGRASLLRLTAQGAEALAGARALRSEWALGALAGWDETDARQLSDLLDRLVADLQTAGTAHSGAALSAVPSPR